MTDHLSAELRVAPIVPLIKPLKVAEALNIAEALFEGGVKVLEVVLRSDKALEALQALTNIYPKVQIGAGTVLSAQQAELALEHGAKFIVSPGLDGGVVEIAKTRDVPVLAGIATATELQRAWNMGLRQVKFFPAGLAGGPSMLKAFSSVFPDVEFMPTGGVNADNLTDYLKVPAVLACGGSWLTPHAAIERGEFKTITHLARQALNSAKNNS